jgi:pimeloyl-ACP methyl ester carboxylesterase
MCLILVDRRGRGESGDGSNYAIEREFDDVVAVVDPIGNGVDLLGHSFGAVWALEAGLRTSHLRKLILYEPPSQFTQKALLIGFGHNLIRVIDAVF